MPSPMQPSMPAAVFVALDLSRTSWVVALRTSGDDRVSTHKLRPGDVEDSAHGEAPAAWRVGITPTRRGPTPSDEPVAVTCRHGVTMDVDPSGERAPVLRALAIRSDRTVRQFYNQTALPPDPS